MLVMGGGWALAHSPNVDSSLKDWCAGATTYTANGTGRVEDTAAQLTCGTCSGAGSNQACAVSSDCPAGQTCNLANVKTETVWWDNRTDGAVNDLGTVAMTQDATNLYIAAELWVDPDPVSLPFGEIALDWAPGGVSEWHDPNRLMKGPGRCSISTDRGCTSDADCQFCHTSDEPTGGCSSTTSKSCVTNAQCPGGETCVHRIRPCGSACDPNIGDWCEKYRCSVTTSKTCGVTADCPAGETCNSANVVQTCTGLAGAPRKINLGRYGSPEGKADALVLFDFSLWLVGAGDATLLMRPRTPAEPDATTKWINMTGCPPYPGEPPDNLCDFPPAVNPGASGGSGGPPGAVEVAIPWSAFTQGGVTGFGPGVPFRFTMTIARGSLTLDFKPDGAQEDVLSEAVAGTSTTSTNSCPGMGLQTTLCELADGSTDAFVKKGVVLGGETAPGGRITGLLVNKSVGSVALNWQPSCSSADTSYEVYEGTIGSWYSHVPVICSTGGATSASFAPAAASDYYLVVPRTVGTEGSYGKDGAGVERPVSASACTAQALGTCP